MQELASRIGLQLPAEDPVLIFGFIMTLILVAPIAARKARLPEIVGLIVAGIVFGPHGIGLLARDASIELLGMVGLLYIMFQAGLEIDLDQVRRNKSHSILFGLITFGLPLSLGTLLGMTAFAMSFPVAILLASMFSSHTLVTFPVVTKLGLAKMPPVTTTIGGTIITDTLALLVLAVVAATAEGDLSTAFWVRLVSLMLVYVVFVLLAAPRLGRWFLRNTSADENLELVFVLAMVFVAGYLAHLAGLEPIIGAFLVGLCLNSLIPERSLLMTRINFTGNAIFIPFFLLSVGMLVDVTLLFSDLFTWMVAVGMITTALFSKLVAAWIGGSFLGYNKAERRLMYGLSVNQAAATLAAVLVGYNIGLFGDEVVTGTILMIAVTCFVGPIVTERAGRTVAQAEESREHSIASLPQRILIPINRRDSARSLLDLALLLRSRTSEEPIYPLSVTQEGPEVESGIAAGERLLAHMVVRAMSAGVPVMPLTNVDVNVASGIIRTSRENRIPLILAAWDGQATHRSRVFGHILDEIVSRSDRTVLISRLSASVASAKRVRVVLPPFADREPGFDLSITLVRTLAGAAGTSLLVYAAGDTVHRCGAFLAGGKDGPEVRTEVYSSWKAFVGDLGGEVQSDEWVIVVSARPGEVAWQPSLHRLPRNVAARFPDSNLTFIYPAVRAAETIDKTDVHVDETGTDAGSGKPSREAMQPFSPEHSVFGIRQTAVRGILERLIDCVEWERRATRNYILELLDEYSRSEAVELVPGFVLLHAHVQAVQQTTVLLGVTKSPFELPDLTAPAHVIVVLLNPVGLEPERHLEVLGRIARSIRVPDAAQRFRNARALEDVFVDR